MAKMDIAEKRLPQDGRIKASVRGRPVDLRVATFPGLHGESLVLRILGQLAVELDLEKLELLDDSIAQIQAALAEPHGIILITGPTGSGKTTTLYAALNAILSDEFKLVTVEDPVEYTLPGVSQLQVKPEIGLTYAAALRTILRNDPDVIMIGEIRDKETADIAVRAALTGHLVLATLHTSTAAGAITRLLDLGIDDFLLAATLILSGSQRLVRKLCVACAQERPITTAERERLLHVLPTEDVPSRLYEPVGCPKCLGRGYAGRTPLFEAISINDRLQRMIRADFDERAFSRVAFDNGAAGLWRHGMQKVAAGVTTLDEIFQVIGPDELCASST
jgi:general secretion pathway protein E